MTLHYKPIDFIQLDFTGMIYSARQKAIFFLWYATM